MKVLIVGGGGREHALAWKIAQSPRVANVYVAPGNAGTACEPKTENVAIGAEDIAALVAFARTVEVDLTIIGPEAPLVAGVADAFEAARLRCFGPRRDAAILEGSKGYAKEFLRRHAIPTAKHAVFSETSSATDYLRSQPVPIVIKADGLAAGKGVVIARSRAQGEAAIRNMLEGGALGAAGMRVVIEEYLEGEEASFIVMTDGERALPLATTQDHKTLNDGDTGPNTGGMGAYSPAPVVTPAVHERVMREVIAPTLQGMSEEGRRYVGFLYVGLMIAPDGTPRVVEYNCRLGDPETQPILMRLDSDLAALCEAALQEGLGAVSAQWNARVALGVVLAAGGYPGVVRRGDVIAGLTDCDSTDVKVFHAGTDRVGDAVVTAGGRVPCVCALGPTVGEAARLAYRGVAQISWPEMQFRRDIGFRAIVREQLAAR